MDKPDRIYFCLENYHAIKKAQLRFNGLTVLCGVNGSGKSSILRWLYYLILGLREFREFAVLSYLEESLSLFDEVVGQGDRSAGNHRSEQSTASSGADTADSLFALLKSLKHECLEVDFSGTLKAVLQRCDGICKRSDETLCDLLVTYLQSPDKHQMLARLKSLLLFSLDLSVAEVNDPNLLREHVKETLVRSRAEALERLSQDVAVIESLIRLKYGEREAPPQHMSLTELGAPLFVAGFAPGAPVSIKRVFYIDTPLLLGEDPVPDKEAVWRHLLASVINAPELPDGSLKLHHLGAAIEDVTGGAVHMPPRSGAIGDRAALQFKLPEGPAVNINRAATGIKSFAYLDRLLKTGNLDRHSLLLIDEPEAHLHPQWITHFARLLVRLNHELGVCVAVSSHSPDMVQALQMLSIYEGTEDNTRFYLAVPEQGKNSYTYVDQEVNIESIFATFNKSLEDLDEMVGELA